MSLYSILESKCDVIRPTVTRDAYMGTEQTPDQYLYRNVICSVQPSTPTITMLFAQRQTDVDTTVYFAQNVNAQANDVLDVTHRDGSRARYLVQGMAEQVARGRVWACHCNTLK